MSSPQNLDNAFNHAVKNNWTWLARTHYIPSVVKGKIVISTEENRSIRSSHVAQWEAGKYLTKQEATDAISKVFLISKERFDLCLKKHHELCNEMAFSIGFNYDGDTHGIYNEYEYISFKLHGFDFQFPID